MVFLDDAVRGLYVNWRRKAQAVVGNLRISCARHPEDESLARLVGSLTIRSTEFAALWQDHRIEPCAAMDVELRHPELGTFTVLQQSLRSGASPEQVLVVHTAPQGSAGADALALITHVQADTNNATTQL
ncbi:hypothetical protein AB0C27_09535 [Nonomuraea sp. NPDC048882]|uniref:MmyB family transcriptional regulator n=1 Tax=Nonomuraea sp. NPDC048882 TaxID=3154347 RepID=UPI0033C50C59